MSNRRYNRNFKDEFQPEMDSPDYKYYMAAKRVKKIKGFYVHLLVYIVVNIFLIGANTNEFVRGNSDFWRFETFSTALFWGIGLLAHGMSVFGRNIFFGSDWEERKIKQLMEEEKNQKWE
jgi:2TM domain